MALPAISSNLGEIGLGSVNLGDFVTNTTTNLRATQVVKEVGGGAAGAVNVRATQVTKEVSVLGNTAGVVNARATQVVKEVLAYANNSNLFGTTTIPTGASVKTGGALSFGFPLVGTVLVGGSSVKTGGNLAGLPLVGSSPVGGSSVKTGGYVSSLGLNINGGTGIPPIGGHQVKTGGSLTSLSLVGSSPVGGSSVKTGGNLAGLPLVGAAPVGGASVKTGGVLNFGIPLVGTAPFGGPVVLTGGNLSSLSIIGTAPFGGSSVKTGGNLAGLPIVGAVTFGGPVVLTGGTVIGPTPAPALPPGGLGGYNPFAAVLLRHQNYYDRLLRADTVRLAAAMRVVAETSGGSAGMAGLDACVRQDLVSLYQDVTRYPYEPDDLVGDYLAHGQRKDFFVRGAILTPTTVSGDNLVAEFQVPTGYFGLLLGYYCEYTGTGFEQGAGDIVWRLRFGHGWVRNMGNLLYSVGSLANPYPLEAAVVLASQQRVQFLVNIPNIHGSIQVGTSRILCGLQGWFYPHPSHLRARGT